MSNSTIYVITAITKLTPSNSLSPLGETRCIGWFPTLHEAQIAIANNTPAHLSGFTGILSNLLQLSYFDWLVIEETTVGLFSEVTNRFCYHWSNTNNAYEMITEPECLNQYPSLGLG